MDAFCLRLHKLNESGGEGRHNEGLVCAQVLSSYAMPLA